MWIKSDKEYINLSYVSKFYIEPEENCWTIWAVLLWDEADDVGSHVHISEFNTEIEAEKYLENILVMDSVWSEDEVISESK